MATDGRDLPAGDFADWLTGTRAVLRGHGDAAVPCGGCTACCRSSQFVHVHADETDTLAHIPAELLFPAPQLPAGHRLLGYDEDGACPMLVDDHCSIYDHRPRACRTYDCRIFPAAGVQPDADDATKVAIGERARRWRFGTPTPADREQLAAVQAAARHLAVHGIPPDDASPGNAIELALAAIAHHDRFMPDAGGSDRPFG